MVSSSSSLKRAFASCTCQDAICCLSSPVYELVRWLVNSAECLINIVYWDADASRDREGAVFAEYERVFMKRCTKFGPLAITVMYSWPPASAPSRSRLGDRRAHGTGRDPAVHQQRLAGDVAAALRGQKHDRAIQVVRAPGPLQRNPVAKVVHPLLVFVEHAVLLGLEPSRRQAIHGDSVAHPVVRQAHGQLLHAATARD